MRDRRRARFSLNAYAVLMACFGVMLVAQPTAVDRSGAGVVRAMGALLVVLAGYYRVAAAHDLRPFIVATIWGRLALAVFQGAAVLVGWLDSASWGGAMLDVLSAVWTWAALRRDELGSPPETATADAR